MSTRSRTERVLTVFGAVALMVMASDALTYAATGSSLVLGRINTASATTTIQNTTAGGVPLRLVTKVSATPPLMVNGKGKVVNLYADRAALADKATTATKATSATNAVNAVNATKLGGSSLAQVKAAVGARPAHVIWVAPSGADFTTVSAALASITTSSISNRYVIDVGPGIYTETSHLTLKNYVDIEGSGEDTTQIDCACDSDTSPGIDATQSVVDVPNSGIVSTVRNISIVNTGTVKTFAIGVRMNGSAFKEVTFDHVTVSTGSGNFSTIGFYLIDSSPTLDHVTTMNNNGSGQHATGIFVSTNGGSSAPLIDNTISMAGGAAADNYGLLALSSTIIARSSLFFGTTDSVSANGTQKKIFIGTVLSGPVTGTGLVCAGSVSGDTSTELPAGCS
jgi:hypothetical protein